MSELLSQNAVNEITQDVAQAVPIEVKWNLPAWMLRDPGPHIEVEDDDMDGEEAQ